MEMKQYHVIEVQKGDFKFSFEMPHGATWGAAIDSAFEILQKLNELSQQAVQNLKPAAEELAVEPEVCSQEGE